MESDKIMEENTNIPPPPSGEIVMPKSIPAPPSGDIVMPEVKKKEPTPASQEVSSNGLPTVSEPLQESGAKDSGPLDLPSSYQSDRSNYKDLVGGSKYKLLRVGKPITGTWDAESQTFIKEPLLDLTPKQKKEVGFLQAVEAGVNLEAPKETQEEVFGRVGVDIDNIKADSKNKLTNIEYLSSFPSVKKVAELETLRNATDDQKVKADIDTQIEMLRSQKMSADEFKGIRFSDGEQKVYQNYLPATGKVEEFKGSVKKLPKTDITVGEAYDEAKGDTEYVQQAQQEISQYNNMVNQYMIDKLPQESKDRLAKLKGTPEYDNELERELVQSNKIENVIPALAYGLDRKLDALMEVGSNLGLDDNRLAQKKLSDIREKQMFGKQMASTRADLASSIGGMLPDIAAGAVFSPLMLGSMTATMPNDFLEQSIAEQYESGEPINIAKAKEYALASTAAQTGLMVGAGLVGGQSINLLGKTALNRAGELITEMAKRGTKDAIVFGGLGTAMQNKINKAFDVAENDEYLKSALHMAIIGSMFALHAGYGKVKPLSKQKANEIDYLASYLPEEYTRKQVEQLVQQGKLGAADGEEISDKLNTYRTIRNQIPAELTSTQMEQIYPLWVERRRLQAMTKDASSEFKSVLNGEVEDIDRKILVKAAVPLTSSERAEKNKLSTAEAENKDIDKSRLRYLEQRDEAAKEVKSEKKFTREKQQGEVGDTETFDNKGNKIADAESSKGGDGEDAKPEAETGVEAVAENGKEEVVAEVVEPKVESNIPTWIDAFEKAKSENNNDAIEVLYNKVKVALNGVAQSKGDDVVKELQQLKSDIEKYAQEWKSANTKIEGTDLSNSEAIKFLDDHGVDGPIQKLELHPDFELNSEELERGIRQIRKGEFDKAGAKKVLAKIDEWKRQGYVDYMRGAGKQIQKTSLPFDMTEALAQLPKEQAEAVIQAENELEANTGIDEPLKNFTDKDGNLDLAKLSEELKSAKEPNYWGDLLGLNEEELTNLQNIIDNEQSKKTTDSASPKSENQNDAESIFSKASDKKIRMAERDKILEEGFGDKAEKAKFVFKNFKNILRDLESKGIVKLEGDCF